MIKSVLYLQPRGGDHQALVDFFKTRGILERALRQDGCLASDLQIPVGFSGPVIVTALWRDVDAYDGWVNSPDRAANAEDLSSLVEGPFGEGSRGELYEVVIELKAASGGRNVTPRHRRGRPGKLSGDRGKT